MIPLRDTTPSRRVPFVTAGLILANSAVFIYQFLLGPGEEEFVTRYAAIPVEVLHWGSYDHAFPFPYTLFSAMFLHGGLLHLGGNMLFLWIFGDNVEDFFGHVRFVLFYLFCGVCSSLAHIVTAVNSPVPMIGASGAISGVLGAYFLLYPTAGVDTLIFFLFFIRVIRIPAAMFLGIWFVYQILYAPAGGGVAWYAHIGGFIVGLIITLFSLRGVRSRRQPPR